MQKLLDTTPKLYTIEDAVKVADELNSGDDEWTYVPVHDHKGFGYSFVEAYDEDGEYVGRV